MERFWAKVRKGEGCWEWTAYKMRNGYGTIARDGGRLAGKDFAHRVSWVLHNGPIPDGMYVCHRCDNPGCVRPDHLFLGTPKENQDDMRRKGRHYYPGAPGERNNKAKLTEEVVRRVHAMGVAGMTQAQIAAVVGITQANVGCILLGKTWKHLHLPPIRHHARRDSSAPEGP